MQTTLKKAVESAGDPEAGLGWVHAQRAMSMVKAARFIVLATAIERNIPSYFWLSTCGAANLELSAFGDCDSCFLGFHKKRKQTNSKKISENTREKDGMAVLQVLQVHRGHKANTFSLLNSTGGRVRKFRCQNCQCQLLDAAWILNCAPSLADTMPF